MDFAIRLSYPNIPVAAVYYFADGTPSAGNNMQADGDQWKLQPLGMPTIVNESSLEDTVVVEWNSSGTGHLAKTFPDFICHTQCAGELYDPAKVITGPMSPVAVNRYHP